MQSYLQYHRFRKTVASQHGSAKEKLHPTKDQIAEDPTQSTQDDSDDKDLEKGDESPSRDHLTSTHQAQTASDLNTQAPIGTFSRDHEATAPPTQDQPEEEESPREEVEESEDREDPNEPDQDLRQYLTRMSTQRSTGSHLGRAMTGVQIRKRSTKEGGEGDVFIVGYHNDKDPLNPHNWGYGVRIWITFLVASIGFVVGFASSVDSMALPQAAAEFGVSEVAESLATGRYPVDHSPNAYS